MNALKMLIVPLVLSSIITGIAGIGDSGAMVNEAKLVAGLTHPNIVQIFDLGGIGSSYYIAMEFADGTTLKEIVRRRGVISPAGILHRMNRDGAEIRQLSANYLNDFTPSVLNDGRIIYTRWEYVDRAACPIQSLWTIKPDGTGLSGYYGNRVISPGTLTH